MEEKNNKNNNSNRFNDGKVIIGTHYCAHCGSCLERYMWSAILQLEVNEKIILLARGQNIVKQERIASLLKAVGCTEIERSYINEENCRTLKIVIAKKLKT